MRTFVTLAALVLAVGCGSSNTAHTGHGAGGADAGQEASVGGTGAGGSSTGGAGAGGSSTGGTDAGVGGADAGGSSSGGTDAGVGGTDAGDGGCVDKCTTQGATQCSGTSVQQCTKGADGCLAWTTQTDCSFVGSTCDASSGTATCKATCVDTCPALNQTRCSGTVIQTCSKGTNGCLGWTDGTDCAGTSQVCDVSSGTATCAAACSSTCTTKGNTRCNGSVVQVCGDAGNGCLAWQDQVDCSVAGDVCNSSGGTAKCTCNIACSSNADCNDNNAATADLCSSPGTCSAACSNPPYQCVTDADCNDGNKCTINTCVHHACQTSTACPGGVCDPSLWQCPDEQGYVEPHTQAQLTEQAVAVDGNSATLQLLVASVYPYQSTIQSLDLPQAGMKVISLSEVARYCPTSTPAGVLGCEQLFQMVVDTSSTSVCTLNGTYTAHFTYSCAPGGDCALLDPAQTTNAINFSLTSANFCSP